MHLNRFSAAAATAGACWEFDIRHVTQAVCKGARVVVVVVVAVGDGGVIVAIVVVVVVFVVLVGVVVA